MMNIAVTHSSIIVYETPLKGEFKQKKTGITPVFYTCSHRIRCRPFII